MSHMKPENDCFFKSFLELKVIFGVIVTGCRLMVGRVSYRFLYKNFSATIKCNCFLGSRYGGSNPSAPTNARQSQVYGIQAGTMLELNIRQWKIYGPRIDDKQWYMLSDKSETMRHARSAERGGGMPTVRQSSQLKTCVS